MAHLPTKPSGAGDRVPFGLGFPIALTRFAQRFPRAVLAAFLVVGVVAAVFAAHVHEAEDLLDFIPPNDPDVKAFKEVGRTFGALRVALVGLEAKEGDDVFSSDNVRRIMAASEAVKNVKGVDSLDSFTSLEDFAPSEMGVEVRALVDGPPVDEAAHARLREHVLSLDHVVGNFVSKDGRAALLLVYLADGAPDRLVSREIRRVVTNAVGGGMRAVFGGAPFAASAIYEETQADVRNLTPIAVLLLLGVILIAFRDVVGVLLTILTTAWAVIVVMGVMASIGEPFTAASATLPVILFASGTSYAVHVLGRYYLLERAQDATKSVRELDGERLLAAVRIVGPPVAIASFTTAAGFVACLVMDIRPMRAFGIECAAGVLLAMIAALLVVPATLALFPRGQHEPAHTGRVGELLAALADWSYDNRVLVLGGAAALAIVGGYGLRKLEVRMEPSAFFRPGSDPWLAERFMKDRFGGQLILQVALKGDFSDPATLDETKRLLQFARSLPGVTQVNSIVEPIMLLNDMMGGGKRVPDEKRQVQNLYFFLAGRASVARIVSPDHDRALVHIRIGGGDSEAIVAEMEHYLGTAFNTLPGAPTPAVVAERVRWITRAAGDPIADDVLARIMAAASRPLAAGDKRLVEARRRIAHDLLAGDSELLPKRAPTDVVQVPGDSRQTIAELADAIGADPHAEDAASPRHAQIVSLAPSPEEGELAFHAFVDKVRAKVRELSVDDSLAPAGPLPAPALPALRDALGDLFPTSAMAPAPRAITWALAGEPILDRGMSRSVRENHKKSMVLAWGAVILFIGLLFRSARLALISVFPSALTMVVLFGGISMLGLRVDLGTSLVTSIATGAGSEFAMQYLWYLQRSSHRDVVRFVGPIMVISTLLIAAGFAVLGLGRAQPMRMFGALAALAIVGSAAFTFLLVPALLRESDAQTNGQPEQLEENAA